MHAWAGKTLIGLGLTLSALALGGEPSAEDIARAVRELGDDSFAVREKASAFLWSAGKAAEPALQAALGSGDLEVVRRAGEILGKFQWGLYPDTPRDIADLIQEYRAGNQTVRQAVVPKLLQKGRAGRAVVAKLAAAEENGTLRQSLFRLVAQETARLLPQMLAEGDDAALDELLELGLANEAGPARQNYAAFLLQSGRLTEKIRRLEPLVQGTGGAPVAETLSYLYRAKGDLTAARRAAERAGKPELVRGVLLEQGAWKNLLEKHRPRVGVTVRREIEALGFLAAFQRLAGEREGFERTAGDIREFANSKSAHETEVGAAAKALMLNDRPGEGIEILIRDKQYAEAVELLCAQLRFGEALALAERAAAEGGKFSAHTAVQRARALYTLGEKEQALTLFAKVGGEIKEAAELAERGSLVDVEYRLGLKEEAFDDAAVLLGRLAREVSVGGVLGQVFPGRGETAAVWWRFLRGKQPAEEPTATMKRVRDLLDGKVADKELEALAADLDRAIPAPDRRELWLTAIADACHAAARDDLSRLYLEKAGSLAALTRLGDMRAEKKRWKEAAECYRRATEKNPGDASALYLCGWALVQAGQESEGRKRMAVALRLPLGDDQLRFNLAEALYKHGLEKEALEQYELIVRTGQFDSWATNMARRHCARAAAARTDYLAAAALDERALLECLRADIAFVRPVAYLAVPQQVHRNRARGLLRAGKAEEALREVRLALAYLPGDVDLAIELVPELEAAGRRKEADELFQEVYSLNVKRCAEFPQSGALHNGVAWLAARCRRQLDDGLAHARKAVELSPGSPGPLDTLAETHFQRGARDEAIALIKQCIALNPGRKYFRKQLQRFEAGDPAAEVPEEDD